MDPVHLQGHMAIQTATVKVDHHHQHHSRLLQRHQLHLE
jgi:hypothetical protein